MAQKLILKAIKLNQPMGEEQSIFSSAVKVKYLIDDTYFKVNWWTREKMGTKEQGYQRIPAENRKKKIAKYIEQSDYPIFPANILITSRVPLEFKELGENFVELTINSYPCWIVDGQTRVEGFKYAVNELKMSEILEHEMPVIFLSNFDLYYELEQFFILNSTQKRVSTDLAQRLKLEIAKKDKEKYEALGMGEMWELKALKIVDLLNYRSDSFIWQGRIRLPNTQKSPINVISQNSFVQSLKPLLKGGIFELLDIKADLAYEILRNYWNANKRIFSDAFANRKEYVIQKTPGVFSLHNLANKVFGILYSQGEEFSEGNIYRVLLQAFNDQKYTSDFWRSDGTGAALAGSMKGFARLADEFKENLVEVSIETK